MVVQATPIAIAVSPAFRDHLPTTPRSLAVPHDKNLRVGLRREGRWCAANNTNADGTAHHLHGYHPETLHG
jgi:hypothetical protein